MKRLMRRLGAMDSWPYYPFDRDQDGWVRNASGNGRDGQILGAVTVPDGKRVVPAEWASARACPGFPGCGCLARPPRTRKRQRPIDFSD